MAGDREAGGCACQASLLQTWEEPRVSAAQVQLPPWNLLRATETLGINSSPPHPQVSLNIGTEAEVSDQLASPQPPTDETGLLCGCGLSHGVPGPWPRLAHLGSQSTGRP